jgi:hypothetical protein
MSRAQHCSDITFVGPKDVTRHAICVVMNRKSTFAKIIQEYLSKLDILSDEETPRSVVDVARIDPVELRFFELPSHSTSYVYMLVSSVSLQDWYIGETTDLKRRLFQHNRGDRGALKTNNPRLRPWYVFAYITNIDEYALDKRELNTWGHIWTGKDVRKFLEKEWVNSCRTHYTPDQVQILGANMVEKYNQSAGNEKLHMVLVARIVRRRE